MNEPLQTREQLITKAKHDAKWYAVVAAKVQREFELIAQTGLIYSIGTSIASVIDIHFLIASAALLVIATLVVRKGEHFRFTWIKLRQSRLDFAAKLEREDW